MSTGNELVLVRRKKRTSRKVRLLTQVRISREVEGLLRELMLKARLNMTELVDILLRYGLSGYRIEEEGENENATESDTEEDASHEEARIAHGEDTA